MRRSMLERICWHAWNKNDPKAVTEIYWAWRLHRQRIRVAEKLRDMRVEEENQSFRTRRKLGIISESRSHSTIGKTTHISAMADVGLKLILEMNFLLLFSFPGTNTVNCLDSWSESWIILDIYTYAQHVNLFLWHPVKLEDLLLTFQQFNGCLNRI